MPLLYLASQSPRRAKLITLLGVGDVRIMPADIPEEFDDALPPFRNVEHVAHQKAALVASRLKNDGIDAIVIGADTTVALQGHVLNKPVNAADAERMLMILSANTHTVYTGVSLIESATGRSVTFHVATSVSFRALDLEEVRRYIATGSPMDKAGAYGIQEDFGAVFVSRIEGDYYNVVGLPLCRLYQELRAFAPELWQ